MCKQELDSSVFNKDRSNKDGLSYRCRKCVSEYKSQLRKKNLERERLRDIEYYKKNKDAIREAKRRSYKKHRLTNIARSRKITWAVESLGWNTKRGIMKRIGVRFLTRGLVIARTTGTLFALTTSSGEKNPEYHSSYKKKNREKENEYYHRRRTRQLLQGDFTILEKETRRLYSSGCIACDSHEDISIDHIIPISRGGRHSVGNLQPMCISCNSSKGTQLMVEWIYS